MFVRGALCAIAGLWCTFWAQEGVRDNLWRRCFFVIALSKKIRSRNAKVCVVGKSRVDEINAGAYPPCRGWCG